MASVSEGSRQIVSFPFQTQETKESLLIRATAIRHPN